MRKRGFTLIELLVVIAIIAILAAILFPVFARARENARKINCLSNLKQVGLGIMQYCQDYDEMYPSRWRCCGGVNANPAPWVWAVTPYIKNTGIFVCPSEKGHYWYGGDTSIITPAGLPLIAPLISYGMSDKLNSGTGVAMAQITTPADKYMILESSASQPRSFLADPWAACGGLTGCAGTSALRLSHFDGMNIAYCDGHAKWIRKDYLLQSEQPWLVN